MFYNSETRITFEIEKYDVNVKIIGYDNRITLQSSLLHNF